MGLSSSERTLRIGLRCAYHSYFPLTTLTSVQLYKEEDLETPVAYWQRTNAAAPPTLVLQAGIWSSARPQIIAAFIIRELMMRMREKASHIALSTSI
jgi:hypothetical protein